MNLCMALAEDPLRTAGECFFLLENRGASVTLRYSMGEDFCLDPNLLIIGTMNSADRNVDEQMDVAFVQRFTWVEVSALALLPMPASYSPSRAVSQLAPEDDPVKNLLAAFLYSLKKQDTSGAEVAGKWLPALVDTWNKVLCTRCAQYRQGFGRVFPRLCALQGLLRLCHWTALLPQREALRHAHTRGRAGGCGGKFGRECCGRGGGGRAAN